MGGSFKNGAGSLDFEQGAESEDEDDFDDEDEAVAGSVPSQDASTSGRSSDASETAVTDSEQDDSTATSTESTSNKYPYFVRRNSVGDERSNRLEVHVRDEVADRESKFLAALADELDTDSVTKTDAREFALKLAHEKPEAVARLMREEGYGELS